jgi:hypothetical protein
MHGGAAMIRIVLTMLAIFAISFVATAVVLIALAVLV